MYGHVGIVGVGLIGASIGLALKSRQLCRRVIGVGRSASSLHEALSVGAIDEAHERVGVDLASAEIVVVATPVPLVAEMVARIRTVVSPEAIITDVASTKRGILRAVQGADRPNERVAEFVGSHPMAGSHKRGPLAGDPNLFEGRTCVVVRGDGSDRSRDRVRGFWQSLGMNVQEMGAEEHDDRVARISHGPHVASYALALSAEPADLVLAGPGFRDTTRLAASQPALWTEILRENRVSVLAALDRYSRELAEIRLLIERQQWPELETKLHDANRIVGLLGDPPHAASAGP
jgi:prephenate dehydrogenase